MSFEQQLNLFVRSINESPYISRDTRIRIIRKIDQIHLQLEEGGITFIQVEQVLLDLHAQAAADEIVTLSSKICYLNPRSPRLEHLRTLQHKLHTGEISASQARKKLQELMHA